MSDENLNIYNPSGSWTIDQPDVVWHTASNNTINTTNTAGVIYPTDINAQRLNIDRLEEKVFNFKLPEKSMPKKVYACGRMLTLGCYGSPAEAMYMKPDNLFLQEIVISPMVFNNKITLSVEYKNSIYHYVQYRQLVAQNQKEKEPLKFKFISRIEL